MQHDTVYYEVSWVFTEDGIPKRSHIDYPRLDDALTSADSHKALNHSSILILKVTKDRVYY